MEQNGVLILSIREYFPISEDTAINSTRGGALVNFLHKERFVARYSLRCGSWDVGN
jgi:hypothetical protein